MNASVRWMIYGANGYTGELIAREAVRRGFAPILAGRSSGPINVLAQELQCERRVFTVEDQTATLVAMQDVRMVLNCAGPFSATAGRLMQACLAMHADYLDITGEIDVFELARSLHEKAMRAGTVLCPGVGFEVVPTDCLAARLKAALPDATHLALAFDSRSRMSVGTTKTSIENAGRGGRIRSEGRIIDVPLAYKTRNIDFGSGPRSAVAIPWGDVSTAYFTTGIPNIEVYTSAAPQMVKRLRRADGMRWLLRRSAVQWVMKRAATRGGRGPSQTERDCNPTEVWGEVKNSAGEMRAARLHTANGYTVTVNAAIGIVAALLKGRPTPGYFTPALLMGSDYIEQLPGSSAIRISSS